MEEFTNKLSKLNLEIENSFKIINDILDDLKEEIC